MKLPIAPPRYGWVERVAMRLLFAWVVERHIPASLSHFPITAPHGIGRFVDLRFLLDPAVFTVCRYLLWVALLLYVLRLGWSVVLPYLTLLSIAAGTIINSHGAIEHYLQIVSLVLGAQTAGHFYGLWKQRWRVPGDDDGDRAEDHVIFWSQQAIVATYLVSALTKLFHTGGMWFFQTPLVALQIIKTTDQDYYTDLDAATYGAGAAMADWIAQHPLLTGGILSAGLLLELATPLALLGRRYAAFFGVSLLIFHETVHRVMALHFLYNEYLLWIYLVNVPGWLLAAARLFRGRFKSVL